MTEKDDKISHTIDKQVSSFIDEVGLYSDEHVGYIEKLNRVLDEMKNSSNSAERKHYASFLETVRSFERYLSEKKIVLTPYEKERLAVISTSGLNSLAKKRMTEDLIHSVRDRHTNEIESKLEEERKKKEIQELKKSGLFILDWFGLLKFALENDTITLFSHRLKFQSFDLLRITAHSWFISVKPEIKKILDGYYFYLSVLEYNSLLCFYNFGEMIESMKSVKKLTSYSETDLNSVISEFTPLYAAVIRNLNYIDNGLKKVFKEIQPIHGFWGFIGLLTDRPIVNGRIVKHSDEEILKQTIKGVLYSYYTIYAGVRVRTLNQLMYLSASDGLIDSTEKKLTEEAKADLEKRKTIEKSEGYRVTSRLNQLGNVIEKYRINGINLADRVFALEAKSNINTWNREAEKKPFFKVVRVLDGIKKYILEIISDGSPLVLEYDGKEYSEFFEKQPELIKSITEYLEFAFELQGSREKDISGFRLDDETEFQPFIKRIMNSSMELPVVAGAKNLREMLNGISAKTYNLCMRFNDIINGFLLAGKKESSDVTQNYDFFLNARLIHPKIRGFEIVVNKKETSLADILEAGCSLCEYVSEFLFHPGIKAVYDEVAKLKEENSLLLSTGQQTNEDETSGTAQAGRSELSEDVDNIYHDNLSGIKKWAYFEDFVLPEYYDEHQNYKGEKKRLVFCAELSNLQDINRKSGIDAGDRIYRKFCQIINDNLKKGSCANIAMRAEGGLIIGYISDVAAVEGVDLLHNIYNEMNSSVYEMNENIAPEPVINAGIYTETKGSNARKNIEIAKRIMSQYASRTKGSVAFLKNPDHIISENDLDRKGYLKEGLISVLS